MNARIYSVREILDSAVEKEGKRRSFYATAAVLTKNPDMKGLFDFLAEEEGKHLATFRQILNGLPEETSPDEPMIANSVYLDALTDEGLYSKLGAREFVQLAIDNWNIFRIAIGFEKDAILYFAEFLPHLSESNRDIVRGLIQEEKGHIRKLVELMELIGE
ncbi:MAG TPA: ferritin family protein [Acidobacteriota bacterium]|nr:ferritin family protein [Acidobacteriota bacterium]